jgi:hypothetical protein
MTTDLANLRDKYKSPELLASYIASANWKPEAVKDLTPDETEWLIYHLQRRERFNKYNAGDMSCINEVSKMMGTIMPPVECTEMLTMIAKCVAIDKLADRPDMRYINRAALEDIMWSRYAQTGEGGSDDAIQRPVNEETPIDPEPKKPSVASEEIEQANTLWREAIRNRAQARTDWTTYIETIQAQKRDSLRQWDEYVETRRKQYARLRSQ